MKKNMGTADRVIRFLIAVTFAVLYGMNIITGTLGLVLAIVAGIFFLTSLISFCPLYAIFGLNTCPTKQES